MEEVLVTVMLQKADVDTVENYEVKREESRYNVEDNKDYSDNKIKSLEALFHQWKEKSKNSR